MIPALEAMDFTLKDLKLVGFYPDFTAQLIDGAEYVQSRPCLVKSAFTQTANLPGNGRTTDARQYSVSHGNLATVRV